MADLAISWACAPALQFLPRGDGHTVLVLPGFLADDSSTRLLRHRLARLGYAAEGWGLGANKGPADPILDGLIDRLDVLARRAEGKVSIVGWSMGGSFARWLGRAYPALVRQVISLGSPVRRIDPAATTVGPLYESLRPSFGHRATRRSGLATGGVLPMPATAVFTRADGIVPWQACVASENAVNQNVEVFGSHSGLGVNLAAMVVMADRLSLTDGEWRPFEPPRGAEWWFPASYPSQIRSAA
jgi:pimeloyl-ACP methyl ester carboxylesterase